MKKKNNLTKKKKQNHQKMVLAIKMVKSEKKMGVYTFEKKILNKEEVHKFFSKEN